MITKGLFSILHTSSTFNDILYHDEIENIEVIKNH